MPSGGTFPRPSPQQLALLLFGAVLVAGLGAYSLFQDSKLKAVKRTGELVVATRNSPTTYYEGLDGPTGIEYDMARAFADRLGVKLKTATPPRFSEILPLLAKQAWYTDTSYGYARGYEAMQLVNRIRTYYDTLKKIDEERTGKKKSQALKFKAPAM